MKFEKMFVLASLALSLMGPSVVYLLTHGWNGSEPAVFAMVIGLVTTAIVSRYRITVSKSGYWSMGLGIILSLLAPAFRPESLMFVIALMAFFFLGWIYRLQALGTDSK